MINKIKGAKKSQGRFVDSDARKRKPKRRKSELNDVEPVARERPHSLLHRHLMHHLWVAVSSLGQLSRTPFSSLMTATVIAIALALPAGLYLLLHNVQSLTNGWQDTAQLSVFLKHKTGNKAAHQLVTKIQQWENVARVVYISPAEALAEFRELSGFGSAIDTLKDNPLPPLLVVYPAASFDQPGELQRLAREVEKLKSVDHVQLDMEWVRRLAAILNLAQRGVLLIGGLLGAGILLIVGNTIRLTIFNRRQEIVVTKLIGATDSFIRRPFLYTGIWYGLAGSLMAWVLLGIFIALIQGPVQSLAQMYQSQFVIDGMGSTQALALVLTGVGLSFIGSWISATRHLQAIEPE